MDNIVTLINKIAQETLSNFDPDQDYLTPDTGGTTVPEPSFLWGMVGMGLLGILSKVLRRRSKVQ